MVVRVATRTVLQRWSLSLNFFFPNFDRHQSIHARIRAHATHSAFHSLSTTSFYIGLALPSILEIYVGSEPGCSWCIEPQLTQWETNLLISLLFDNKRQGLSNHGHFPRPTAEARKGGGGKLSLGQAGPVRLLVSSSAQHDLPRYLGPCFRGILAHPTSAHLLALLALALPQPETRAPHNPGRCDKLLLLLPTANHDRHLTRVNPQGPIRPHISRFLLDTSRTRPPCATVTSK